MIGTIAIVAALICVAGALYRFAPGAPAALRTVVLVAALAAGVLGLIHWSMMRDSRWLVGSVLLLGAAYPGWAAGNRHGLTIAAVILSLLGAALFGIAVSRPMQRPVLVAA